MLFYYKIVDYNENFDPIEALTAEDAVREVASHLYDPAGGIIAQLEFGAGANPATAIAAFEEWEKIDHTFRSIKI